MMAVHKSITEKQVFLIGSNAGPSPIAGAQCSPYQFITSWQGDQAAEAVRGTGVHVGPDDVAPTLARERLGADVCVGWSLHRPADHALGSAVRHVLSDWSCDHAPFRAQVLRLKSDGQLQRLDRPDWL